MPAEQTDMPRAPLVAVGPGSLIGGRIRLVRQLAAGGMGTVWLARNEMTRAELAVKTWQPSDGGASVVGTAARFRLEARLGARLAHRNIVRIYDLLEEPDGTLVLVMELLRGETLEHRLRDGLLSGGEAVATLLPVLSALDHAHEMGIVHRDIKPGNVFLAVDPDGVVTPKLLDFGIAKATAATSLTVDGNVLGSPRYMSPEQIRGEGEIDGRSDVFAAAIVLCEMLTGTSPFERATAAATLAAVLEQEVDPMPEVEPRLWTEIARALAKRPYERHRSAAELAEALRTAVGPDELARFAQLRRPKPFPETSLLVSSVRPGAASGEDIAPARSNVTRWIAAGVVVVAMCLLIPLIAARLRSPPSKASAVVEIEPARVVGPPPPSVPSAALLPAASGTASATPAADVSAVPPHVEAPPKAKPRPPPHRVATTPGF